MDRILSQEEISELLSAVRQGEIDVEPESDGEASVAEREVSKVELVRMPGQGRWRVASFDLVLDAFARNFATSLSNRLQQSTAVRRTSIQAMAFDALLQQLSDHGAHAVLRIEPLRYGGLFALDETLAFTLVELLLGGSGASANRLPQRALTTIEANILKSTVVDACSDLGKAFRTLETFQPSLVKIVNTTRQVTIVPPDTDVMVAKFAVTINQATGTVALVIPLASLEPLREKLRQEAVPSASSTGSWLPQLSGELDELEVPLAARLASISLPLREILNFRVGDIIDLNTDPGAPLNVLVEGKAKFLGLAGIRNGRKAVRLGQRTTNGAEHGKISQ